MILSELFEHTVYSLNGFKRDFWRGFLLVLICLGGDSHFLALDVIDLEHNAFDALLTGAHLVSPAPELLAAFELRS